MLGRLVRLVLLFVVIVAVATGALLATITLRALPQTSGTIEVAGLDDSVTITRDRAGVPHLFASTSHDLFMAQGYVHAQDRMWQMEVWRHISAGRLSELFGKSQVATDRFIRTLDWRGAAARDLEALSPEARDALEAYAEGVNAWLDGHRGGLGLAFVVTGFRAGIGGLGGYDPEPWTALDSAAWQKVQSWNLGGNVDEEIFRFLADDQLGDPARTDELFPDYHPGAPVIAPEAASARATEPGPQPAVAANLDESTRRALRELAHVAGSPQRIAGLDGGDELVGDHGLGSNNWVVAPSKSESGGALLANDPHLGIGMPSVWYVNGLHCVDVSPACPFDVLGVSFPGTPAVVLGHNADIAWGATNTDPDVQDLFIEQPSPADPDRYQYRGQSVAYTIREEEILVSGGPSQTLQVRETVHGPILNDVDERLEDAPPMALRWAATAAVDTTFEAIFRLQTATNFDDFRAALRLWGTPSQNFVYADVAGHIGFQIPGRVPVRGGGATGERPVAGHDGAADWTGWVEFDALPWALDPAAGWIVTANNAPLRPGASPYLGSAAEWDPGYRAAQITQRLGELADDGGLTVDELELIQMDSEVRRARAIVPSLRGMSPATADGQSVLFAITNWDLQCEVDSLGCAAYMAAELRLIAQIFDDELGPLARDWVGSPISWRVLERMLNDPEAAWWDDITTQSVRETAPQIISDALDRTGEELRAALGEPENWRWGALHQATFREETLGRSGIGPLEAYFNRGPVEVGGAAGTIQNNTHRPGRGYPDPNDPSVRPVGIGGVFAVDVLPSYRLTIDLSDLDDARIVQTTGQSGNPFDGHYGDLIDLWRDGRSVTVPFSRSRVDAAAASTLVLTPSA